jgi:hypothetical protein
VASGPVQLGDDVRDRVADARDFCQAVLFDQDAKWDGESGEVVCRPGISLRAVRIAAAKRGPLRILPELGSDRSCVGFWRSRPPINSPSRDALP